MQVTTRLQKIIASLWWLALAYLPFAIIHIEQRLWNEIGCHQGDCYLPGTSAALELQLLVVATAVLIWPACLWRLVVLWRQRIAN